MPITIYPQTDSNRTTEEEIDLVEKGVFVSKTILENILIEMKINNVYLKEIVGEKLTLENL